MNYEILLSCLSEFEPHPGRKHIFNHLLKFQNQLSFYEKEESGFPVLSIRKQDLFLVYKEEEFFNFTFFLYSYEEIISSLSILFQDNKKLGIYIPSMEELLTPDILNACIDSSLLKNDSESFHLYAQLLQEVEKPNH